MGIARVGAILLCFVCVAACSQRGHRAPIIQLDVLDRTHATGKTLKADEETIRTIATRSLAELGAFELRPARPEETPWQMVIRLELSAEGPPRPESDGRVPKDRAYRAVRVDVSLVALRKGESGGRRYESQALVGRNLKLFESVDPLRERAIVQAFRYIGLERGFETAQEGVVLQALKSDDPLVVVRAIRSARDRKLKNAIPHLLDRLADKASPPDVVALAIGALIDARDPRAVEPLIDSARWRPRAYLGQILFGLAQIGGKKAEAYLFTVAGGHKDATIRGYAKDALRELERRQRASAPNKETVE